MTIAQVMQALIILCAALFIASASATPCPNACKCFTNDNGIQAANCTDLPDQMTTAWPQKILRIHFGNDHASPIMLKNKAFKHFPRLTYLDITDVTIQYVGISAFDGLPELLELNLVGTGIRKLPRDAFAGNRKLAFLSLKKNPRLFVGPSFLVSDSVTELDLSECALTSLKSVFFKSLTNLKYLFAMKNDLKVLGSQFGPPGLKYVSLAYNHIESIHEDLETYKRLRTIDLTGNPVNCTCELSEIDRKLTARGVAFGNTITCKNTGKPLGDMIEVCVDKEMMGDDPMDMYKADGLLKIDQKQWQSMEENNDSGSGSGSGDYELVIDASTTVKTIVTSTSENHTPQVGVFETTSTVQPSSSSEDPVAVKVNSEETTEQKTDDSSEEKTEETTTTTEKVIVVHVEPTVQTSGGGNVTSTARSGMDGGIVPLTIQAPEDREEGDDVQTKVAEYLKTNVGITGTAVILAVVIIAIVYKAVCMGKKRSRSDAAANEKSVELKEIKYMAADTEDSHDHRHIDSPTDGSVEENLLDGDRDSDDDDDDADAGDRGGSSPGNTATNNGHAQNGDLLNSVLDAVKSTSGNGQPNEGQDVPTRVVVKLGETPKTSKPIAINNVH